MAPSHRAALLGLALAATGVAAEAGILGSAPGPASVRGSAISICFVGSPERAPDGTLTPDGAGAVRLRGFIHGYLAEHQAAANIDYVFLPVCPPPVTDGQGRDVFGGDLRVLTWGTDVPYLALPNETGERWIPGAGCPYRTHVLTDPMTGAILRDTNGVEIPGWASWGGIDPTGTERHCLYNMRMGNDGDPAGTPWRNHTLHEFGHSLGFAHEMDRFDTSAALAGLGCPPSWVGGWTAITTESYDLGSVMNYTVPGCPAVGNYRHSGLTELERLSLHIMYPEDVRVAEFAGRTVLRVGEMDELAALWPRRGASVTQGPMILRYRWEVDGAAAGTSSTLRLGWDRPGMHMVRFGYDDFAGRDYDVRIPVRVLAPAEFDAIVAVGGALIPP